MNALRKTQGSYEAEARAKGFMLQLKPQGKGLVHVESYPKQGLGPAPGFDDE
jgi:hypothetical protein